MLCVALSPEPIPRFAVLLNSKVFSVQHCKAGSRISMQCCKAGNRISMQLYTVWCFPDNFFSASCVGSLLHEKKRVREEGYREEEN